MPLPLALGLTEVAAVSGLAEVSLLVFLDEKMPDSHDGRPRSLCEYVFGSVGRFRGGDVLSELESSTMVITSG